MVWLRPLAKKWMLMCICPPIRSRCCGWRWSGILKPSGRISVIAHSKSRRWHCSSLMTFPPIVRMMMGRIRICLPHLSDFWKSELNSLFPCSQSMIRNIVRIWRLRLLIFPLAMRAISHRTIVILMRTLPKRWMWFFTAKSNCYLSAMLMAHTTPCGSCSLNGLWKKAGTTLMCLQSLNCVPAVVKIASYRKLAEDCAYL